MKKVLQSAFIATSLLISSSVMAQLPDGSICPNFTGTDLNGNTVELYELLDQGYSVIIDVSATWCGPCWNYHNTGTLETLYTEHGPAGFPGVSANTTDEVMVLFIEGDAATNTACLSGPTGCVGETQGNWVAGTPYPIIDDASIGDLLATSYFPTIYTVCPNRILIESGQASVAQHLANITNCPSPATEPIDPAILAYEGTDTSCDTFEMSILLQNYGLDPLTACTISVTGIPNPITYEWTGSLNTYQLETVDLGTVTLASSATATISISSTDGNPSNSTLTQQLNFIDASQAVNLPNTTNFTATGFPYANWQNLNPDGGIGWEIASTSTQGNAMFINTFAYNTPGQLDDVITAPFNLMGATDASLTFKYANRRYNATYYDKLRVSVSSSCTGPWTQVWFKENTALATGADQTAAFTNPSASDWRTECVDLSSYAGTAGLFVKFTNDNNYGNNIFVDDIKIENAICSVGLNEAISAVTSLEVYPNPFSTTTNLVYSLNQSSKVVFHVFNMLGEQVKSIELGTQAAGSNRVELDMNDVSGGIYFVNMVANGQTITKKITLTK